MSKTLVAYFSASGVTKSIAERLAKTAGADLFEIEPAKPYTAADLNWNDKNSRSTLETNDPTCRPAIASKPLELDEYSTIYLGFPIWWYVAPAIIKTFMESPEFCRQEDCPLCDLRRQRHGQDRKGSRGQRTRRHDCPGRDTQWSKRCRTQALCRA